jgi:hypothetical protein
MHVSVLCLVLVSLVSCGILLHFLFQLWLVDALTTTNARITALEAEFTAS